MYGCAMRVNALNGYSCPPCVCPESCRPARAIVPGAHALEDGEEALFVRVAHLDLVTDATEERLVLDWWCAQARACDHVPKPQLRRRIVDLLAAFVRDFTEQHLQRGVIDCEMVHE